MKSEEKIKLYIYAYIYFSKIEICIGNYNIRVFKKRGIISIVINFKTINGGQMKHKQLEQVNFEKSFTNTLSFKETSCDAK